MYSLDREGFWQAGCAGGTGNLLAVLVRLKAGATIEVQVLYGWMPTIQ
jgi:hypothetical protein